MTENPYDQWLAKCREVSAPADLADRIMSQVANMEHQRRSLLVVAFGSADRALKGFSLGRVWRSARRRLLAVCLFSVRCPVCGILRR